MPHHLRVAQNRRAGFQRRPRALSKPFRHDDVVSQIDHAAGMDHPHDDDRARTPKRARSASAWIMANDRR
jgi:hypothetical protein